MTISPEQFNKIALRDDMDRVENKVDQLTDSVKTLAGAIDNQTKKLDNIEHAFVSNQAAHV